MGEHKEKMRGKGVREGTTERKNSLKDKDRLKS